MAGLLARIFRPSALKHAEGEYRDGPWELPYTGGWLPHSWGSSWNWWQQGYDPLPSGTSAIVQACVSAYAQTIAMCPGAHWLTEGNGGRKRVTTSALSRILRKPNAYQSISDFLLNLTRSLYLDGNAYAVALRNARNEIEELHLMNARQCGAMVAEDGSVFYDLGGNEVIERQLSPSGAISGQLRFVPARDVLHVKLDTPVHPLRGEPPLTSAAMDVAASNALVRHTLAFFANQSRPSGILSTDQVLTKEQAQELKARWDEQVRGMSSGGVPILTAGLKFQGMSANAQDSQLAEILQWTDTRIAAVFRVPLAIVNLGNGTGPQGSTESLMRFWVATGLGFPLNHLEEAFGNLFGLAGQPNEYLEFDTAALLRSDMVNRVAAAAQAVQGGIYSPNEARAEFELPAVKFGDEPRVQQQVVPLSFALEPPKPPAPPAPPPAANDDEEADDGERLAAHFRRQIAEASERHAGRLH